MNYTLTDAQQAAVETIAKAELRPVKQMVGLLLAEGINWMYVDYSPKFDDIKENQLEESLMKECREL